MAVEQVARWPWNAWPDERGLGGRMVWNPHDFRSGQVFANFFLKRLGLGKAEVIGTEHMSAKICRDQVVRVNECQMTNTRTRQL